MTAPVRLQLSRQRGFRLQEVSRETNGLDAVKVDRSTFWGNPCNIPGLSVENSFWLHHAALTTPDAEAWGMLDADGAFWRHCVLARIDELRGFNLACWCKPPAVYERDKCHAATLIEIANP